MELKLCNNKTSNNEKTILVLAWQAEHAFHLMRRTLTAASKMQPEEKHRSKHHHH